MGIIFRNRSTISICVLVIGLFGCVTITINTPLPAYQLLVYSNGLSPSTVSLRAFFFLLCIYLLCQGTTRPSWLFFFILSHFSSSSFFYFILTLSRSFLTYFSSTISPSLSSKRKITAYTTLDRLYMYVYHLIKVKKGIHNYMLGINDRCGSRMPWTATAALFQSTPWLCCLALKLCVKHRTRPTRKPNI